MGTDSCCSSRNLGSSNAERDQAQCYADLSFRQDKTKIFPFFMPLGWLDQGEFVLVCHSFLWMDMLSPPCVGFFVFCGSLFYVDSGVCGKHSLCTLELLNIPRSIGNVKSPNLDL